MFRKSTIPQLINFRNCGIPNSILTATRVRTAVPSRACDATGDLGMHHTGDLADITPSIAETGVCDVIND